MSSTILSMGPNWPKIPCSVQLIVHKSHVFLIMIEFRSISKEIQLLIISCYHDKLYPATSRCNRTIINYSYRILLKQFKQIDCGIIKGYVAACWTVKNGDRGLILGQTDRQTLYLNKIYKNKNNNTPITFD